MSTDRLERIKRNLEQKHDPQSSMPKAGTLSQFFDCLSTGDNVSRQCTLVDAFLHTYRIFATTEQVLLAADRKFWDLCYSEVIPGQEKLKEINSLRLILSRWLRQPHVRDFDSVSGLAELHRFNCIVVSWYRVFRLAVGSEAPGTQQPGQWTSRYVDQLPPSKSKTISRLAFSGTDQRSLDRVAYKLEYLCKHAEYRAKALQSKYASGGDSGSHASRQIYRRREPQSTLRPLTPVDDRLRKLSAPPGVRTELFNGLETLNVAEELTVIDQRLFMNLLLPELLENVRGRPSPTYTATVNQFNRVVNAVQCSVLRIGPDAPKDGAEYRCTAPRDANAPFAVAVWSNRSNVATHDRALTADNSMETFCEAEHKRANILAQWIDVAWRLRQLNNLTSLQAVLAALQIGVIRRLRHSWTIVELLHAEHYRRFEALNAFMDISENHERVREHMRRHLEQLMKIERARRQDDENEISEASAEIGGMIPYLGIFMSDLTFLNSAQPDYVTASSVTDAAETAKHAKRGRSPLGSIASLADESNDQYRSERGQPRTRNNNQSVYKFSDPIGISRSDEPNYLKVPRVSDRSRSRSKDTANPADGEKLINFAKHVREANTLRDLYLLQYSASFYHLKSDPKFQIWFDQFPQLTEQEAMKYSLLIEPTDTLSTVSSVAGTRERRSSNKSMSDIQTWSFARLPSSTSLSHVGDSRRARSGSRSNFGRHQRVSVLTNPYFAPSSSTTNLVPSSTSLAPSSIDSPYHSSSEVESPSSSPPTTSSVNSHLFRSHPNSKKSSPQLLNRDNHCGRLPANCGSSLPQTPDVFARVMFQDQESVTSPQGSCSRGGGSSSSFLASPTDFFKQVAKLGSTPNLASIRKASAYSSANDNHSILERVLCTDRIADLLARVLIKFGLPVHNMSQYDLIHVREGMPDRVCPIHSHAITALLQGRPTCTVVTDQLTDNADPRVCDCVLVRNPRKSSVVVNGLLGQCPLERTAPRKFSHYGTLSRIRRTHLAITDMWSPAPKLLS